MWDTTMPDRRSMARIWPWARAIGRVRASGGGGNPSIHMTWSGWAIAEP